MQTIYRPGNWYLLVRSGALVALPPDAPGQLVAAVWDDLATHGALANIIGALADGGSFLDLPSFVAAVVEGDDVRVAARGRVVIRVTDGAGGGETVSGTNVSTWSERFIADAARIDLTVDETDPGEALPVLGGIVLASAASIDLSAVPSEPVEAQTAASTLDVEPLDASAIPPLAPTPPAPPAPPAAAVTAPSEIADTEDAEGAEEAADAAPDAPDATDAQAADAPADGDAIAEDTPEPTDDADGMTLLPNEVTYAPPVDEFAYLWGETQHTPIEAAAVRPEPESEHEQDDEQQAPEPTAAPAPLGDHDGATISAEEARALRTPATADETPTAIIPQLGTAGRIRLSTGQTVALDRTVIIGRRPRSTRASGSSMPHLIAVESPQQDISRNHLEVRPEGDAVVVIDLNTTNGSMLHRPGTEPMRLHPGEQTLVLDGDLVDLGDGVTVTFEGLA